MSEELLIDARTGQKYKTRPSGIIVPYGDEMPTGFDFFAGAGGFSLGFIQAGFRMVGALELNEAAAHTYMSNLCSHPVQLWYTSDKYKSKLTDYFEKQLDKKVRGAKGGLIDLQGMGISGDGWIKSERENSGRFWPAVKNFFFGDIREASGVEMLKVIGMEPGELDVIIGGPPCQGYSKANTKRNPNDPRNGLVFEFARMICEMNPKTFVMEEVPDIVNMVTPEGVPVLHQFMRILEDGQYMAYEDTMKALGITEKELGIKSKYVVRPDKNWPRDNRVKKQKKRKKKQQSPVTRPEGQGDLFDGQLVR